MEYAIFKAQGKQYKASVGDVLDVDQLPIEKDGNATFEQVLLVVSNDGIKVGSPFVKDASVVAKVLDSVKGDKIRVSKYKAKVRYRKTIGFRPKYSRIQIKSIGLSSVQKAKAARKKAEKVRTRKVKSRT